MNLLARLRKFHILSQHSMALRIAAVVLLSPVCRQRDINQLSFIAQQMPRSAGPENLPYMPSLRDHDGIFAGITCRQLRFPGSRQAHISERI